MDPAQMHGHVYHAEPVFIQNLVADEDVLDEKSKKKEEKKRLKYKKKLARRAK